MDKWGLTIMQLLFADAYIESLNATWSAGAAGYSGSETTLAAQGSRNTRIPKIKEYIAARLSDEAMSAGEVLTRLAQQAKSNPLEFITDIREVEDDGDFYMIVDWDLDALKKNGHMVKAFRQGKHGIHITFVDPQKALELLGKFHVLFTDKVQIDTAELEIVALIREGKVEYEWMVEKSGESLAERLFKQANVPISKE